MAEPPVLLLAPTERDADSTRAILNEARIPLEVFRRLPDLLGAIEEATGVILLSEPTLTEESVARLARALGVQPSWSEIPIVLLTDGGGDSPVARRAVEMLGNVTLVQHPVRVAALVSVLRSSLRARRRQYQLRDQLVEVAELNRRLERLAFYDPLTDLPNRVLLRDRLAQAVAHARRSGRACAVLFLDVDDFKLLNDSLGHDVGDGVLRVVAERLRGALRDEDTAGRLGGDEFVMVLPDLNAPEDAAVVARKATASVAEPIRLHDREVRLTTSLGIAPYTGGEATVDDLLRQADLAMYEAKARGKGSIAFATRELRRRASERSRLEHELREALEAGDLTLHYQPKVRLADGVVVGAEALVRWPHPSRGLLGPDAFLPLVDEIGLAWELGRQVLERACREARAWQRPGRPGVRVAVNLSDHQLRYAGLVASIEAALATSGLPADLLELEIGEDVATARVEDVRPKLRDLKALGVRLTIDDVGTGRTSWRHLPDLPIDALEIDRTLLPTATGGPSDRAIVHAVATLAARLGLDLVGEGIETEAQRRFLADLGCREGQGFLFGAPSPTPDLDAVRPAVDASAPTGEPDA